MKKTNGKASPREVARLTVEATALVLFIFLTAAGRLQLWFGIFIAGVVVSVFAGRLYCGWLCPMNTVFRIIMPIRKKLGLGRIKGPSAESGRYIRYAVLILFLIAMAAVRILHLRMNLLLYITALSALSALIFGETFWHRSLCPFGTILSISSRRALRSVSIDDGLCSGCGICRKVCPSDSIYVGEDGKMVNAAHECLECYRCIDVCPAGACSPGSAEKRE